MMMRLIRNRHLIVLVLCLWLESARGSATPCLGHDDCMKNQICSLDSHRCVEKTSTTIEGSSSNQMNIIGTVGAFVAVALSAGGGLGGGGLMVPLFIIVLGMTSHDAIPLSKATIFGSAIASFIINSRKKHPQTSLQRPLIDYESMLMMEPMTLAGTIIGVNLNSVFPEWLITVLLVLLLTRTSWRTFQKGKKIYSKEAQRDLKHQQDIVDYWRKLPILAQNPELTLAYNAVKKWKAYKRSHIISVQQGIEIDDELDLDNENENNHLVKRGDKNVTDKILVNKYNFGKLSMSTLTLNDLYNYKKKVPVGDIFILFFTWMGLFVFSILKGGHGAPSIIGLECGSGWYWVLVATSFPFFILVTVYFGSKTVYKHSLMQSNEEYIYAEGDVVWTKGKATKFPALCMLAGVAAGLLGIGGGMVKGPLLLEMGLLPEVSAATSSTMILFTSSATTIQFIVLGMLPLDLALWYGCVGFFSAITGQLVLSYFVKKYRKTALVVFLIAVVIGVSGMIMGGLGFHDVFTNQKLNLEGFGSFCPS